MKILHLFNWELKNIIDVLPKVEEQGFDAVLINPIQPLKEDGFNLWWLSYQPVGFKIGNQYGSKEDLERLCLIASEFNIKIFSDVICTHVAGSIDGSLNTHYRVDKELVNNPYFWKERRNIENWNDRYQVTNYCPGLPALDVKNYDLQDKVISFLNELIDCGVRGFRFDSAKNIALPEEGCDFFPRVLSILKRDDIYSFGEVICSSDDLINRYSRYLNVLTDNLMWSDRTVVYPESHDTYQGFEIKEGNRTVRLTSSYVSTDDINRRYRELEENHSNVLYYARPFDDNNGWLSNEIKDVNLKDEKVLVRRY